MKIRTALLSVLALLCANVLSNAQTEPTTPGASGVACSLINGDRISGKVAGISPAAISLTTELLGTLTLPRAAVSSCQAEDGELQRSLLLFLNPGGVAPGAGTDTAAGGPEAGGQPQGEAAPAADATSAQWKRTINFSYAFASGNADISDMNVAGVASRKSEAGELSFSGLVRHGVKNGEDVAAQFVTKARYDRNFKLKAMGGSEVSLFNELGFERDALKRLDRRVSWNGGMSLPVRADTGGKLSLDVGGGLTREDFATNAGRTVGSGLLRLKGEQKVFSGTSIKHEVTAFPVFEDLGRYRLDAEVTLRAPLTRVLAFSIGGVNRFDRRPPEGVKRNDFSLLSGIALEF